MSKPEISIGLPVFNGERYLRSALESLLAQDVTDFELIISDNASSDSTQDICLEYARRDRRIQYSRNAVNLGSAKNFSRVFELSSGTYFMWAAHDDLWHPSYIGKCLAALREDPDLALCGTDITFIDNAGDEIDSVEYHDGAFNTLNTQFMELRQRVRTLTEIRGWYALYGVIRAESLRRTRLCLEVFGADVILLMELLFQGPMLMLPEKLFSYRLARKSNETYIKDLTAAGSVAGFRPYTDLACSLLAVIDAAECRQSLKEEMKLDLLDNVCERNVAWRNDLFYENPSVMQAAPHFWGVEARRLLMPDIAAAQLERLRERAYRELLSGLPVWKRTRQLLAREMERHVLWRLRRPPQ